ncbi:ABC transporter [Hahella sp. CCB-MM4]|uniref:ABC transporter ATP-binding protein n=1 Tax=Hahella sp. (strain CCB-MM4) TaxID=1926491 RepID=UPI000B9A3F60|nr:sn-glycerol-3-phosphate ABC transporter ATP-binding protein UgpC [Hahella sp. CCB-MM4]OZG74229.1 ABC transporter [Hahella sp. CCB-MM4]
MASVTLEKVKKSFGQVDIIKSVDLAIADGEFVVFVGPSGCGKSTLLRLIAGLEDATDGDILIDNHVVNALTPKERGIGMVFQSYALYPHMTVYENIAFGLELNRESKDTIEERVMSTARILQLEKLLKRKPKQLSGGQRQRVAMGRAMAREPSILLFDEPLSNLDAALRVQMRAEIKKLHERLASTMIYVTHDQVEAMTLADKIVVLNGGRVEQVGTPFELYETPATTFVATFIGSPKMNLLPAKVVATGSGQTTIVLPHAGELTVSVDSSKLQNGDQVQLGIRPEHLNFIAAGKGPDNSTEVQGLPVRNIEYLGNESFVYAGDDSMEEPFLARLPVPSRFIEGERVLLDIDPAHVHVFDSEGMALVRTEVEKSMAAQS